MNAQATIVAALNDSTVLTDLLIVLPGDDRDAAIYTEPIDHGSAPDAYMPGTDTLRPSIYVSVGGAATEHPQAWKITDLAALYPECYVYAPVLSGFDGKTLVRKATDIVRGTLEGLAVADEDTGIPGRLGWFGDLPPHQATEFENTYAAGVRMQYRIRWR